MAPDGPTPAETPRLTALPIEQAVAVLRRAGSQRITRESLQADAAQGAPTPDESALNLILLGAWLVRALAEREALHGD